MGEAKRRKRAAEAASARDADIRLMNDLPLSVPAAMGEAPELDVELQRSLFQLAGMARRTNLDLIKRELAKEPDKLVNILLGDLELVFRSNDETREWVVSS